MDKLADQLSQVLAKLQDPGLDAARRAVRLDGVTSIVTGGVTFTFFLLAIAMMIWVKIRKPFGHGVEDVHAPVGLLGLLALILFVWSISCFLNPWVWAAFNDPDLILAAKILKF